ncbi:hypothetical protein [Ruegeria sp.]|uniref:hypothetical protein n=1 Tax=Ruegeria sp. TaxID=1879320 RepID=UPI003C7DD69A
MSEPHVVFGCLALSTAVLTLLTVAEALGVDRLPFGGSSIAQAAIVYLTPLGTAGIFFAIAYIMKALNTQPDDR